MAEKVQAYRAKDGSLFAEEQAAKDHDFGLAFTAWWDSCSFANVSDVLNSIMDERMKLLPIFKLLNGGSNIVPIYTPPLERAVPLAGSAAVAEVAQLMGETSDDR